MAHYWRDLKIDLIEFKNGIYEGAYKTIFYRSSLIKLKTFQFQQKMT